MKRVFLTLLIAAVAIGTSPESIVRFDPAVDEAEAGFRGGGGRGGGGRGGGGFRGGGGGRSFGGGGGGGFGARPYQPPRGAKIGSPRPSRPAAGTRPSRPEVGTLPTQPSGRPDRPGINPPGGVSTLPARPGTGDRPVRPSHPIARPPGGRPPGGRPPGWKPPGSRPPGWRPPPYDPPYYRPPHWHWGDYYWWPAWGWYFTGAIAGATLVYVASLPSECEKVLYEGETLYLCDGVLYRATYYKDEMVYEIVSDETVQAVAAPAGGGGTGGLALTSPMMVGEAVRALQRALTDAGYDVGAIDGTFGPGTDRAVRAFQSDQGLPVTGVVDAATAAALGL
ncbi:peptidoglycan-binding protein [Limibaculum sp. M0105]|uniref:Peptidoglycan-binding protein n=1 Tax=Thermohalobaculum xanthum TaxID=2753746 RepID=A0A8J7M7J4_9RHOB|nr:peptidoglycan-binding domain-containing protein [Thermohalobaculum xanthum]MBK0399123.1 peptidoglycan-binding protein [Thermohalobaculum xanthum]